MHTLFILLLHRLSSVVSNASKNVKQTMDIDHEPFLSISNEFGHDSAIVGCFGCQVVPGKVAKDRSPADQYLFSVSSDGHVQCWDSKSHECVLEYYTSTAISGGINDPAQCLSAIFENDGAGRLYTGTKGGLIRCFDLLTGTVCTTFRNSNALSLKGHNRIVDNVTNISLFDDLAVSCSRETIMDTRESTVRIWRREFGECIRVLRGHSARVTSTKVLNTSGPNRTILLSSSFDRTIRLWDTRLPDPCVQIMTGHRSPVGELVHDSGVVYSTGLSKSQSKGIDRDSVHQNIFENMFI